MVSNEVSEKVSTLIDQPDDPARGVNHHTVLTVVCPVWKHTA